MMNRRSFVTGGVVSIAALAIASATKAELPPDINHVLTSAYMNGTAIPINILDFDETKSLLDMISINKTSSNIINKH